MYFFKITDNPKMACLKKGQNFKFFCSEQKRTLYKYNIKNHRDDSEMPLVPKLERLAEEIEKLTEQGLAVTPK